MDKEQLRVDRPRRRTTRGSVFPARSAGQIKSRVDGLSVVVTSPSHSSSGQCSESPSVTEPSSS
jgi:hypothetical protein